MDFAFLTNISYWLTVLLIAPVAYVQNMAFTAEPSTARLNYIELLLVAIIYTLATAEGSVRMMRRLLRTETGKRKVGAR